MSKTPTIYLASGLTEAFLGYGEQGIYTVAVYDLEKCIQIFMKRDRMTREEALDHMSYNVTGSDLGRHSPVFLNKCSVASL